MVVLCHILSVAFLAAKFQGRLPGHPISNTHFNFKVIAENQYPEKGTSTLRLYNDDDDDDDYYCFHVTIGHRKKQDWR